MTLREINDLDGFRCGGHLYIRIPEISLQYGPYRIPINAVRVEIPTGGLGLANPPLVAEFFHPDTQVLPA